MIGNRATEEQVMVVAYSGYGGVLGASNHYNHEKGKPEKAKIRRQGKKLRFRRRL